MPRCTCAGSSCSCIVQVGDGLTISGSGNASAPFTISLTQSLIAINQTVAGTVDLSTVQSGSVVFLSLSAAATGFTFPTTPGIRFDLVIKQITASNAVTWGSTIKWPGGTNPTVSATINYTDWFVLRNLGGSTWIGAIEGQAIR